MVLTPGCGGEMMAVLEIQTDGSDHVQDHTLHYLLLVVYKTTLNALVLGLCLQGLPNFSLPGLRRSFMGLFSASLCLVDVLLLAALAYVWLHGDGTDRTCQVLSHASTTYSALPLPALLLGMLDLLLLPHTCGHPARRVGFCVTLVLLAWAMAGAYSYLYGEAQTVELRYEWDRVALLCPVRDSQTVLYFCLLVGGAAICLLPLLTCHQLCTRFHRETSDLRYTKGMVEPDSWGSPRLEGTDVPTQAPPTITLLLGFAINWTPFLAINVACAAAGVAAPAYITVNLLWLLCANSLMVGVLVLRGTSLPEDAYVWGPDWEPGMGAVSEEQVSNSVYAVTGRKSGRLIIRV